MKKIADMPELETHNLLEKFVMIFTVPILNALPASLIQKMMRKSSHDAATVVAKGGSTHALEAMYTRYHRGLFSRGFLQGVADMFWHHFISQPKALRNRLRIVQSILEQEILARAEPIFILSIAGGSARALVSTLAKLHTEHFPHAIHAVILDRDETALEIGRRISVSADVEDCFEWICGNANDAASLVPHMKFDIVEIVGLLDYFDDERIARLLDKLYPIMKTGGALLVANVVPNEEQTFVHKTGWPPMHYRTAPDFAHLVETAGFTVRVTITEPLGVHAVVLARVS
ncbi:MAG: hypothetical protein G01um101470_208 [Parcubacteria group bacterium Gr01-1014_70]|nr:MAG: hypothetical protein G01um101470_208 [Parcubacteria group bacterium Gr01-1014_70]